MPTTTTRMGLSRPTTTEAPLGPAAFIALTDELDPICALDDQGILASRPVSTPSTPGIRGRYYFVTGDPDPSQNGNLWRDNGIGWDLIAQTRPPAKILAEATRNTNVADPGPNHADVVILTAPAFQADGSQVRIELSMDVQNPLRWATTLRRVVGGGSPVYVVDTADPSPVTIYDTPPAGSCVYTLLASSGTTSTLWSAGAQGGTGNGGRTIVRPNTTIKVMRA